MLKANTSDSFPGADFVAAAPVTAGDCCLHSSFAALISELQRLGLPYIVRGGRLYWDQTDEAQETMCSGVEPDPESVAPNDLIDADLVTVADEDFGAAEGTVWLGSGPTWMGSQTRVQQTVVDWGAAGIDFEVVHGALPISPPAAYCYVMNACGRVNKSGVQVALVNPP